MLRRFSEGWHHEPSQSSNVCFSDQHTWLGHRLVLNHFLLVLLGHWPGRKIMLCQSLLAPCLVLHWSYRLEPGSAAPFLPAGLYENHLQVSAQIFLSPFGVGIGSLTKTMRGNGICLLTFLSNKRMVVNAL